MITRPLDLSSKLRLPPRNFDFLFLVNGGLIALFFTLFSSHFVLSPGLRVNGADLILPVVPGGIENAVATPVSVSVNATGQIFIDTGLVSPTRLREWLAAQAKREPGVALLVIIDARVPMEMIASISDAAIAAGFGRVQFAVQPATAADGVSP